MGRIVAQRPGAAYRDNPAQLPGSHRCAGAPGQADDRRQSNSKQEKLMSSVPTRATTPLVAVACALALAACATDPATPPASASQAASAAARRPRQPTPCRAHPRRRTIRSTSEPKPSSTTSPASRTVRSKGSARCGRWRQIRSNRPSCGSTRDERDRRQHSATRTDSARASRSTDDALWACVNGGVVRIDPDDERDHRRSALRDRAGGGTARLR